MAAKLTQNIINNPLLVKPVIKAKEMEDDMFKHIESWARETFEDTKLKLKDEIVFYI